MFYSSAIRLGWARQKLDELSILIQQASEDAPPPTAIESSDDRMRVLFKFQDIIADGARRLISEYALHARCALDYLVFDLAWKNKGSEQDGTQFPIAQESMKFPKRSDGAGFGSLEHLTADQVALVESVQPFNGYSKLRLLSELSNRDKHREFVHISVSGLTSPVLDTQPVTYRRRFEINLHGESDDDGLSALQMLHGQLTQIIEKFRERFGS